MELLSAKEHLDVIALAGIGYFVWSAKRILGKLEKSIDDLTKGLNEAEGQCEERVSAVYDHIEHLREARDEQMAGITQRLATLEGEHRAQHGRP